MTKIKVRSLDFTRMKRSIFMLIVILALMLSGNPVYSACESTSCVTVASDLSMKLCVEYQTLQYEFKLVYVPDKSALFWKMDTSTFKQIQSGSGSCIHIENDYTIKKCHSQWVL